MMGEQCSDGHPKLIHQIEKQKSRSISIDSNHQFSSRPNQINAHRNQNQFIFPDFLMMMLLIAETIISFLVHEIGLSIIEEINFLRNIRDQVFSLRIKLRYLQTVPDCDTECSKFYRIHRDEIGKIVREIENVIDEYALIFRRGRLIFRPCVLVRVHRIGVKIDRIQRRIQEAVGAVNEIGSLRSVDNDDDKEPQGSCSGMRSRL